MCAFVTLNKKITYLLKNKRYHFIYAWGDLLKCNGLSLHYQIMLSPADI